ncbi:hypothetical protein YTPLAS18_14820 [Nitrospira sp.]|nr:hypothetical protein YTPLAS18_14820 [Nitrospira sp.]
MTDYDDGPSQTHPIVGSERTGHDDRIWHILKALEGLRFGSVEIVVHNSRIVQIARNEKWRFSP